MIPYEIIRTGSSGNATVLNENVLVDCGIPYREIEPYVPKLNLVLLTHIHSDHFNVGAIRKIHASRPGVRFGCGRWMAKPLADAGIPSRLIDVYKIGGIYDYGPLKVEPVLLIHNVENCGYKMDFNGCKVIYATDTVSMTGVEAKNFDLYLVEANYTDEDIDRRIHDKQKRGEYAYEVNAKKYHMSQTRCDDWLYKNMGQNSRFVYMHQHVDRDGGSEESGEDGKGRTEEIDFFPDT